MSVRNFFTPEQKEDITLAIKNAELDTSGEIRVHVENTCKGDVKDQAAYFTGSIQLRIFNGYCNIFLILFCKEISN